MVAGLRGVVVQHLDLLDARQQPLVEGELVGVAWPALGAVGQDLQ